MGLSDIIRQKIQNNGPISFRDYMDMALYFPGLGYYTSSAEKIGKSGDYYTSPNVSPAFGAMIAKQLTEMTALLGNEDFTIVECGAGTGLLAKQILNYFEKETSLSSKVNYKIVEKSPAM